MFTFRILGPTLFLLLLLSPEAAISSTASVDLFSLPGRELEEILRLRDERGWIQSSSEQPGGFGAECDIALTYFESPLRDLIGSEATGRVVFCLSKKDGQYRVVSVSVVPDVTPEGVLGVCSSDLLAYVGVDYRISKHPIVDVEDGLASRVLPCEQDSGKVEIWIFPDLAMEAYVERSEKWGVRVVSVHVGERFGGYYPPCDSLPSKKK